jgi:ABC-type methionine transport system permease subunit
MTHANTQPASSTGQIEYTVHIKGGNYGFSLACTGQLATTYNEQHFVNCDPKLTNVFRSNPFFLILILVI